MVFETTIEVDIVVSNRRIKKKVKSESKQKQ